MEAALGKEPVLAAGETPGQSPGSARRLAGADAGAPHVLVVPTPHRGLTWLRALGSRQAAVITAILSFFTGFLISDGYSACQQLLPQPEHSTATPGSWHQPAKTEARNRGSPGPLNGHLKGALV
jgi:hypothetical protein